MTNFNDQGSFAQWMFSAHLELVKSKHLSNQLFYKDDGRDLYQTNMIVFPVVDLFLSDLHLNLAKPVPHLKVNSFTWMAVGPLGKPPHQPILRGEDEAAVLVIVGVLEDIQELQAEEVRWGYCVELWMCVYYMASNSNSIKRKQQAKHIKSVTPIQTALSPCANILYW